MDNLKLEQDRRAGLMVFAGKLPKWANALSISISSEFNKLVSRCNSN